MYTCRLYYVYAHRQVCHIIIYITHYQCVVKTHLCMGPNDPLIFTVSCIHWLKIMPCTCMHTVGSTYM